MGGDCWRGDNTVPLRALSSPAPILWASKSTKPVGGSTIKGTKVHVNTDPTELRLEKAAGRQESSKNP